MDFVRYYENYWLELNSMKLLWNKEALVYGLMGNWDKVWYILEGNEWEQISLVLSRVDNRCDWLVYNIRYKPFRLQIYAVKSSKL